MPDYSQMLPVGTMLDHRYRIERYLASGGFGNTYEATDMKLRCRVAVKEFFLSQQSIRDHDRYSVTVTSPTSQKLFTHYLEKFKTEAIRISQLHNDRIVRVTDRFDANGTSYYVMDYIEGASLKATLRQRGPLTEQQAIDVTRQVINALSAVHAAGLYHLDINCNNVMLTPSGKAILIDFGASKQMGDDGGVTLHSQMIHTPGFAPPEQTDQKATHVGPWTDFYALGATLYAMLTGEKPPTFSDIISEGGNAFHFPPSVSLQTRQAVMRMMTPAHTKRPKDTREVLALLGNDTTAPFVVIPDTPHGPGSGPKPGFGSGFGSGYGPGPQPGPTPTPKPSHKWLWLSIAACAVIVAVIFLLPTLNKGGDSSSSSLSPMAEIVEKAKIEGDSWNERQWEKAITDYYLQAKPILEDIQTLKEKTNAATTDEEKEAIQEEANLWLIEHHEEYEQLLALDTIIENNPVANSLSNDEEFIEKLNQELGMDFFE